MQRRNPAIVLVALLTLANGALGILHTLFVRVHDAPALFSFVLPFGVHHWSKHVTLASGFLLVDLSWRCSASRRAPISNST